jgi:hypothetical protein
VSQQPVPRRGNIWGCSKKGRKEGRWIIWGTGEGPSTRTFSHPICMQIGCLGIKFRETLRRVPGSMKSDTESDGKLCLLARFSCRTENQMQNPTCRRPLSCVSDALLSLLYSDGPRRRRRRRRSAGNRLTSRSAADRPTWRAWAHRKRLGELEDESNDVRNAIRHPDESNTNFVRHLDVWQNIMIT